MHVYNSPYVCLRQSPTFYRQTSLLQNYFPACKNFHIFHVGIILNTRTTLGIHWCNSARDYRLKASGETRQSFVIVYKAYSTCNNNKYIFRYFPQPLSLLTKITFSFASRAQFPLSSFWLNEGAKKVGNGRHFPWRLARKKLNHNIFWLLNFVSTGVTRNTLTKT